jgi:hypothetical protein
MPRIILPREVLASDLPWRSAGSVHQCANLAVELPDRRVNRTLLAFAFVEGCRHLPAEAGEIGTRQLVELRRRIFEGIDGLALAQHFEMQVRTGRAAGVAGEADQIALQHHRPGHDAGREATEMAIDRAELPCPLGATERGNGVTMHACAQWAHRREGTAGPRVQYERQIACGRPQSTITVVAARGAYADASSSEGGWRSI